MYKKNAPNAPVTSPHTTAGISLLPTLPKPLRKSKSATITKMIPTPTRAIPKAQSPIFCTNFVHQVMEALKITFSIPPVFFVYF